jgi:hypothetical protein
MSLPKSKGLVTLDEIRECMDRIDATLTVLAAAVARLGAPVAAPRPTLPFVPPPFVPPDTLPREPTIDPTDAKTMTPKRGPRPTSPPPAYAIFTRGGRVARKKGIDREACPFKGDRGIAGARRRWWLWGFDNPMKVEA